MRSFIAIPLADDAANDALDAWLRKNQLAQKMRIVSRGNRHITLKFLGEIMPEMTEYLAGVLQGLAEKIRHGILPEAPQAMLRGFGFFPDAQRPRVFWLGVGEGLLTGRERPERDRMSRSSSGQEWFQAIFAELEDALCGLGFRREERPYFPHITLSRLRGDFVPDSGAVCQIQNEIVTEFVPQRIVLYRSRLGGGEARYDALASFPLTASDTDGSADM
jgi:RNA 2',3'-cyclic 3'-phosphodiesterase